MAVLDETLEEKDHSLNIPEGYFSGLEGVNHLPVNNSQNNDNNQSIYNSSQESYEYSVRAKKSSKTGFSLCILTSFILIIYLGAFLSSSGFETPCFSLLYQEREYTQCSTRESVFSNLFYSVCFCFILFRILSLFTLFLNFIYYLLYFINVIMNFIIYDYF